MPVYEYTALDINGKTTTGIIDAESAPAARQKLRSTQTFPIAIQEMAKPAKIMEHLARRILDAVRSSTTGIENVTLRLSKMNPPVGGKMESFQIVLQG